MKNEAKKSKKISVTDKENELFDKVNDQDEVIGTITRKEAHTNKKNIHRAVIVLVYNTSGHILLQKRSLTKDMYPGSWATSCSGHVGAGQSYEDAAKQELWEELGINVKDSLTFLFKDLLKSTQETEYIAVFKYVTDQQPKKFDEEVSEVKYLNFSNSAHLDQFNTLAKAPDLAFVNHIIMQS